MRFFSVNEYAMSAPGQSYGCRWVKVTGRNTPSFGAGALGRTTLFKIDEMPDFRDHLCVDQKGKGWRSPASQFPREPLLDFSAAASFGDLLGNRFRIRFRDGFLDRFRRTVDEVLGFFQPESRYRAHNLDHVD